MLIIIKLHFLQSELGNSIYFLTNPDGICLIIHYEPLNSSSSLQRDKADYFGFFKDDMLPHHKPNGDYFNYDVSCDEVVQFPKCYESQR